MFLYLGAKVNDIGVHRAVSWVQEICANHAGSPVVKGVAKLVRAKALALLLEGCELARLQRQEGTARQQSEKRQP